MIGKQFGRWTVIGDSKKIKGKIYWLCQCNCDKQTIRYVYQNSLNSGVSKSCGCLHKEIVIKNNIKYNTYDLEGKFGIGKDCNGNEFYFDLEDYELIKDYYWRIDKDGYFVTTIKNRRILMHRLILELINNKEYVVDHINHQKNDNRKENIRICTQAENSKNIYAKGYTKYHNKYYSYITVNGNHIYLGNFDTEDEAKNAYINATKLYFGEYSFFNSLKLNTEESA